MRKVKYKQHVMCYLCVRKKGKFFLKIEVCICLFLQKETGEINQEMMELRGKEGTEWEGNMEE